MFTFIFSKVIFHGQGWSRDDFKGIMCSNVIIKIWFISSKYQNIFVLVIGDEKNSADMGKRLRICRKCALTQETIELPPGMWMYNSP